MFLSAQNSANCLSVACQIFLDNPHCLFPDNQMLSQLSLHIASLWPSLFSVQKYFFLLLFRFLHPFIWTQLKICFFSEPYQKIQFTNMNRVCFWFFSSVWSCIFLYQYFVCLSRIEDTYPLKLLYPIVATIVSRRI